MSIEQQIFIAGFLAMGTIVFGVLVIIMSIIMVPGGREWSDIKITLVGICTTIIFTFFPIVLIAGLKGHPWLAILYLIFVVAIPPFLNHAAKTSINVIDTAQII